MDLVSVRRLLSDTRALSSATGILLGIQLAGNLYEEIVTNPRVIVLPLPGSLVNELAVGSPLYFYLPWVPFGLVAAVVLAVRIQARAPLWVRRRFALALVLLIGAVAAKFYLIRSINPRFRDASLPPDLLRDSAIHWAWVNGAAIALVAGALWLMLAWRGRLLDEASGPA